MYGNRIREIRKEKNLTIKELADQLGISFTTLGNYEREDREPKLAFFLTLADHFGVPIDYFFNRRDRFFLNDDNSDLHERISFVLNEVYTERQRQHRKWGEQNHEWGKWLSILGEEYGEVCQAINHLYGWGKETDSDDLYGELIQLAAVSVQMAEFVRRKQVHKT